MFDEVHTRPILVDVCRRLGRRHGGAELLRHHTNAVYAVEDLVVKIAPPGSDRQQLRSVMALVLWLTELGFPTVGLHPAWLQPVEVGGLWVTVWQRLDRALHDPVTSADLGDLLRKLHVLPQPLVSLRQLRPIEGIRHSISVAAILRDKDRAVLLERLDLLSPAWSPGSFPRDVGLIHSDPQVRNALRRSDGTPVLADWDGAAIGPPEWDVATIAVHCRRFAATGRDAFTRFVHSYGWDPREWAGFEPLCQLRELQMIATNARKSQPGSAAADEVRRRIAGLETDSAGQSHDWTLI